MSDLLQAVGGNVFAEKPHVVSFAEKVAESILGTNARSARKVWRR